MGAHGIVRVQLHTQALRRDQKFRSCNRVTNNTFPYHFISLFLSMGIFTEPSLCRNTEHRPGIPDGIATSCREPPDPHQTANAHEPEYTVTGAKAFPPAGQL
ncbi:uncharacterized protein LOC144615197 isoform X3 [Panthera onca]